MGVDFIQRKQAKKARKRAGKDFQGASERPKRERKKKNAPRSVCRGMCYSAPVISAEDRAWRGEEEPPASDVEPEVRQAAGCRRLSLSSPVLIMLQVYVSGDV